MTAVKLKFSDRWMFNRVMCQEHICKRVIKAAFGIEVEHIEYLNAEQACEPSADNHGVRMDVVAKATGRVFDLEMQVAPEGFLGKRMRYYQSALDVNALDRGHNHQQLPDSFILFVCLTDVFGFGLPVYSIERRCIEEPGLRVGDESHWMVLNAQAWADVGDTELGDLLHYVKNGETAGSLSREIDALVITYNDDRKWVGRVTTLEQEMAWQREASREKGEERFAALVTRLLESGRVDDIARAAEDRSYRQELFKEFGL